MIVTDVFDKKQTILNYSVKELTRMLAEGNIRVRNRNQLHVRKIRNYIFDNVLNEQIYLPPLVACLPEGSLKDGKPEQLVLIDGTQRLLALSQIDAMLAGRINSEVPEERKQGTQLLHSLGSTEIAVQVFEGMSEKEADQLYIDLNTKSKKVSLSKRIAYDSRNEINRVTNSIQKTHSALRKAGVELEKRALMRPSNKSFVSLSQLRRIVALFGTGKDITSKLQQEQPLPMRAEETMELVNLWFDELFRLHPPETIGDYDRSMLASFPLLFALANFATEGLESLPLEERKAELVKRMRKLKEVDWSPRNKVWREFQGTVRGAKKYFYLDSSKPNQKAIENWLKRRGGE